MGIHRQRRALWHHCLATSALLITAFVLSVHVKSEFMVTAIETKPVDRSPTAYLESPRETIASNTTVSLDDILLIIKTGATESLHKLPPHFATTLKSWPNVLLLSDFNEEISGRKMFDALDIVTEDIRTTDASFELWHQLNQHGRRVLSQTDPETSEQISWLPTTTSSQRQEGWRLARFMNLPMAVKAQQYKHKAKWYIFIDADTYISASNTLHLLRHWDPAVPIYAGSQVPMGSGEFFAHGGSGYVFSSTALDKVVRQYLSDQAHWDVIAQEVEFGEVPLARALLDLGIPLTWAHPHFQGGDPMGMDFGVHENGRRVWCYAAVTYHHVDGEGIKGLWEFEEAWRESGQERPFRHGDVFKHFVLPKLGGGVESDWDNVSDDVIGEVESSEECREICRWQEGCVQWSYHDSVCKTDTKPKLGRRREGVSSGWMLERVQDFVRDLDRHCEKGMLV